MPRTVTESSCITNWRMRRSPSALTVASCLGDSPMIERLRVTLSFLSGTDRLLDWSPRAVAATARRVQVLQPLDPAQRVERGLEHVVRIVGAERLREDVLHARRLEDRPHRAAGDDARAGDCGLQEHPAGAEVTGDLAGDRRILQRHEDQVLLGVLHRLADRLGHLVGLAEADPDVSAAVADDDERREREPADTLHDLGHAVDGHHAVVQLEHARIDLRFCHYFSLWRRGLRPPLDSPANPRSLKHQAAGARRIGERLHASVIHVAAAIEHHALDALRLGLLGQELADELGGRDVAALRLAGAEDLAPAVHRQERPPRVVVDQLRIDVVQAAEHRQSRPPRGAAYEPPQPLMPDVARRPSFLRDHFAPAPAFLPTFRRTTSSAYLMPLPL